MYQYVTVEARNSVAIVTLDRPAQYNAWHNDMRAELRNALATAATDDAVRAVVLTGAGKKAFCAGQDLAETQKFTASSADAWMDEWKTTYGAIRNLDKPIIAALNGVAAGSGFQAALLCDIRVGHAGVRMGQPEINSGLPSALGTWLLQSMVGHSRTVELVLTGRLMEADEAYRLGLIHHLVPQDSVLDESLRIASDLASKPPIAMKLNKRHLRDVTEEGFSAAEAAGRRIHGEAYASGEPQMMMEKFFEARRARKGEA